MKFIKHGIMYNTETAECLGSWSMYPNSSNYRKEALYRKTNGEYFLHCEGGPKSIYGEVYGDRGTDGEVIIPYTYREACEWAEHHLDPDDYEAIFGEVSEDGYSDEVAILEALATVISHLACKHDLQMLDYIEQLLNT